MAVKSLTPKKRDIRLMPMARPDGVERDVYLETQGALANAQNMIESILNKHKQSIIDEIRPENIGDVTKLDTALCGIANTRIKSEQWKYTKTQLLEEAKQEILCEIHRLLEVDYPELCDAYDRVVQRACDNIQQSKSVHLEPSRALLVAAPSEDDYGAS